MEDCLKKSIEIDTRDLQSEYARVSADIAHYSECLAEAYRSLNSAKLQKDVEEARLYLLHRNMGRDAQGKLPTETTIQSRVRLEPTYLAASEVIIEAELQVKMLGGVCEAIRTKRDMLVSLGATVRTEMKSTGWRP